MLNSRLILCDIIRGYLLMMLLLVLVLPNFSLAKTSPQYTAQMPQTIEEAENLVLKIIGELPPVMINIFKNEVLPLWEKMWNWLRPVIDPWWQKFLGILGKEVEKKRPALEKELKRETREMQNDLWERFKALLK